MIRNIPSPISRCGNRRRQRGMRYVQIICILPWRISRNEYQDQELLETCDTIWDDMVHRRMYVTGSVGSSGLLERFTTDYDLPNDSNYSETCASIALAMFGKTYGGDEKRCFLYGCGRTGTV